MIERYSLPDMDALFSDVARFGRYLEIELHALDAHAALGVVPSAAAMLLFSVFSSRLVNNECSCLGSFRGALYRAPHHPHRGRGLCK